MLEWHLENCQKGNALKSLWKEILNSDGQHFHQYQQNEQTTLVFAFHNIIDMLKTHSDMY
jgi:hypothetical protein